MRENPAHVGLHEIAQALNVTPFELSRYLDANRSYAAPELAHWAQGEVERDYGVHRLEVPLLNRWQARVMALCLALVRAGMPESRAGTAAWTALAGTPNFLPSVVHIRTGGIGRPVKLTAPEEHETGWKAVAIGDLEQAVALAFAYGKPLPQWYADGYRGVRLVKQERPKLPESVVAAAHQHGSKEEKARSKADLASIDTPYSKPRRGRVVDVDEAEPTREVGLTGRPTLAPVETGAAAA